MRSQLFSKEKEKKNKRGNSDISEEEKMTYMLREIRRFGEGTLAVSALERLVSIVSALVDREGTSDGKRFSTAGIIAHIRSWRGG